MRSAEPLWAPQQGRQPRRAERELICMEYTVRDKKLCCKQLGEPLAFKGTGSAFANPSGKRGARHRAPHANLRTWHQEEQQRENAAQALKKRGWNLRWSDFSTLIIFVRDFSVTSCILPSNKLLQKTNPTTMTALCRNQHQIDSVFT